jgi:hypothetical protein
LQAKDAEMQELKVRTVDSEWMSVVDFSR